ncbi:MAG: DUF427 domain-containing protein [Rhodospirillales bacterium]|nr:DUF427 domain-containing protein [Rhodospirillales bacterium]
MGRAARTVDMAPGFSVRPDYQVTIAPSGRRVRAVFNGEVIADSTAALVLQETRHAPTYYFPRKDVRMDLLTPTDHLTHCPFKGNASYWSIEVGGKKEENVVWSYEEPYKEAPDIAGYLAFYWDKMEAWYEDDTLVHTQLRTGKSASANPLVDWLLSEAWDATTSRELTKRLAGRMNECGMEILRLNLVIQTLHPLLAAIAYRWSRAEPEVSKLEASHDTLISDQFRNSPLAPIFEGSGGVRRWIDARSAAEYPILDELKAEGATDYVAMPMRFSDGQINAITIATDAAGGFSTENLGYVHEILPMLSRLFEVHAKQRSAATLMRTFMGKHTGERVLNGQIRRGDGEDVNAVIWFSDLRNSTPLAESMSRADFLIYLNRFFDGMAGAVVDNGGEILRFIGDAVLAIFPIAGDGSCSREARAEIGLACERAVTAAMAATAAIAQTNIAQASRGEPEIRFGIGIHIGDLTYGNIGIPERLEFTVIGAAANEAARIEAMTKELQIPVLISDTFASS